MITDEERNELAVAWLTKFARENNAIAEGKHAKRVLDLLTLARARAEGAGSMLLDVQQDSINATKERDAALARAEKAEAELARMECAASANLALADRIADSFVYSTEADARAAAVATEKAEAMVAALREALDSAKFFWRGEYPGEGPTAQMVSDVLRDTEAAAKAHDEREGNALIDKCCAVLRGEAIPLGQDPQLCDAIAERDTRIADEARRAALEEALAALDTVRVFIDDVSSFALVERIRAKIQDALAKPPETKREPSAPAEAKAHKSPVTMLDAETGDETCDASDCWCRGGTGKAGRT